MHCVNYKVNVTFAWDLEFSIFHLFQCGHVSIISIDNLETPIRQVFFFFFSSHRTEKKIIQTPH